MVRLIAFLVLWASTAQAQTVYDREQCIRAYDDASHYLAHANGDLWKMYDRGVYSYDWYTFAHNRNTQDSFDALWRINRASRVGFAYECWRDNQYIKSVIDRNMRSFK